ncbi:hypothetical protein LCGC14_0141500 [marine sediment metagenome]|uniref:Transcriptional regulator n=1 Tax=marine sediment metagenome TaxID=412755 RepID=A0A0F9XIA2_9ZZZZ
MLSTERGVALQHLCEHRINDADEYGAALEMIDFIATEEKLTDDQKLFTETLISIVDEYEEKHYPYGN